MGVYAYPKGWSFGRWIPETGELLVGSTKTVFFWSNVDYHEPAKFGHAEP